MNVIDVVWAQKKKEENLEVCSYVRWKLRCGNNSRELLIAKLWLTEDDFVTQMACRRREWGWIKPNVPFCS